MNVQIQFTSLKDVRRVKKSTGPKLIINIIILLFIAVNLAGLYAGNIYYKKAFEVDTKKDIDQFESNKSYFNVNRYNSLEKEEVSITSTKNNYKLYGTYIKNSKATKNTVILVHDLGGSRWSVLKYADMYLDRGFNVLIYDSRDHGYSGGTNVTYGYYEKYDLDRWVNWLYSRNKGGIIGVHGESLGAATALLHSELNESKKKVSFYVSDSSYSDLTEFLNLRLRQDLKVKNSLSAKVLLFYIDKVNKLRNQFYLHESSPINAIKDVTTPILFIHGDNDTYVPKSMTEALYAAKTGSKDIYIAKNSAHDQSYINNQEEYRSEIYKFLDTLNIDK